MIPAVVFGQANYWITGTLANLYWHPAIEQFGTKELCAGDWLKIDAVAEDWLRPRRRGRAHSVKEISPHPPPVSTPLNQTRHFENRMLCLPEKIGFEKTTITKEEIDASSGRL